MLLEEALKISKYDDYLYRRKWKEAGSNMLLMVNEKNIKNLKLTNKSLLADDWEIKKA